MELKTQSAKLKTLFICTFLVLLISGCQPQKVQEKAQEAIPVTVSRVTLRDINESLQYVGDINAQDEAVVYPKVSGKIIEKVKVEGEPVNKGEVIAYIDRDETGFKFEKAPIESPLSGIVGRVYVDIGENVGVQTPVALVVNIDKVKIDLDIPEKYLPKVVLGQEAEITVDAYPQETFTGKVVKISPVVSLDNRSAPIEILLDNPQHHLKSGMFARVDLIIEKRPSVAVVLTGAGAGLQLPPQSAHLALAALALVRQSEIVGGKRRARRRASCRFELAPQVGDIGPGSLLTVRVE